MSCKGLKTTRFNFDVQVQEEIHLLQLNLLRLNIILLVIVISSTYSRRFLRIELNMNAKTKRSWVDDMDESRDGIRNIATSFFKLCPYEFPLKF